MQNFFNSRFTCAIGDTACLNGLDLPSIITAQTATFATAVTLDPAAGQNEPFRPVLDGTFITSPLDLSSPFPDQSKRLLITTVAQDAGFAIYSAFPQSLPEPALRPILLATFGTSRTDEIITNPLYTPVIASDGSSDIRPQLQLIGTDYLWRCSSWSFARNWVQSGGTAFVGEYIVGSTYPGNEATPYCTQAGITCHQDDILMVVCLFSLFQFSHIQFSFHTVRHSPKSNNRTIHSDFSDPKPVQVLPEQRQPQCQRSSQLDPSYRI